MIFNLRDGDTLYAVLLNRDPRFDGQAFVGVRSTGIFCRLTCPARKLKRGNYSFYTSPTACIDAWFRPCKRCFPMHSVIPDDTPVRDLLTRLDKDPTLRWMNGYSPHF